MPRRFTFPARSPCHGSLRGLGSAFDGGAGFAWAGLLAVGLVVATGSTPPEATAAHVTSAAAESSLEDALVASSALAPVAGQAADGQAREDQRLAQVVQSWLHDLNSDVFATRRRAEFELIQIGPACLPAVEVACRSDSAEVRARSRRVFLVIRHRKFLGEFQQIAAVKDDAQLNLEQAMGVIAEIVEPSADRAWLSVELDRLTQQVRHALGKDSQGRDLDPAQCDPKQAMQALCQVLFAGPQSFRGNAANYYDPRNSSLHYLLKSRQGLPILLSHLAVAVGERLKLPIVGLALPYRYMFKYEGRRAPPGFPKSDIVVDAFGGGRIVTEDDLEDIITQLGGGFDPLRHLLPSPRRATLERMLRNLQQNYARNGDQLKAWQLAQYLRLVEQPSRDPALD